MASSPEPIPMERVFRIPPAPVQLLHPVHAEFVPPGSPVAAVPARYVRCPDWARPGALVPRLLEPVLTWKLCSSEDQWRWRASRHDMLPPQSAFGWTLVR